MDFWSNKHGVTKQTIMKPSAIWLKHSQQGHYKPSNSGESHAIFPYGFLRKWNVDVDLSRWWPWERWSQSLGIGSGQRSDCWQQHVWSSLQYPNVAMEHPPTNAGFNVKSSKKVRPILLPRLITGGSMPWIHHGCWLMGLFEVGRTRTNRFLLTIPLFVWLFFVFGINITNFVLHQYRWSNVAVPVLHPKKCDFDMVLRGRVTFLHEPALQGTGRAEGPVGDRRVALLGYSRKMIPRPELSWFWLDWLGFMASIGGAPHFSVAGASGHVALIHLHHVRGFYGSCDPEQMLKSLQPLGTVILWTSQGLGRPFHWQEWQVQVTMTRVHRVSFFCQPVQVRMFWSHLLWKD